MTSNSPMGPHGGFLDDGGVFMGARRDPAGCSVALFGVAYDGTTSFRPGTRFGPAAIRAVSEGLETYDPQLDRDLAADFTDERDLDPGLPPPLAEAEEDDILLISRQMFEKKEEEERRIDFNQLFFLQGPFFGKTQQKAAKLC